MIEVTLRTMQLARDAAQAGVDAAVTIAARTPKLASGLLDPIGENGREARLMVEEKVEAAMQGAGAAHAAMADFWFRAAFGRVILPEQWTQGMLEVADAAFQPARQTVRANAERLTRKPEAELTAPQEALPAVAAPAFAEPPREHVAVNAFEAAKRFVLAQTRGLWPARA